MGDLVFRAGDLHGEIEYNQGKVSGRLAVPNGEIHGEMHDRNGNMVMRYLHHGLRINATRKSSWYVDAIDYNHKEVGHAVVHGDEKGSFTGVIDYGLVRHHIKNIWGIDLAGAGALSIDGFYDSKYNIHVRALLEDAVIRLPHSVNVLHNFEMIADIDVSQRCLFLRKAVGQLNKGHIRLHEGCVFVNSEYKPSFFYLPLTFHDCFVHWQRDLTGTVSGFLLLSSDNEVPFVKGALVVDRAYVQSNVLSSSFEKKFVQNIVSPFSLSNHPLQIDIDFISHAPVAIRTAFLNADAHLKLSIKGTISAPELFGTIIISQGSLNFPYQPLYIIHGRIYFLSSRLQDPL